MASVSLIVHSAKITKERRDQSVFALSAYSFKTAITDQRDAYTILCLLEGNINIDSQNAIVATDIAKEPGASKSDQRYGIEYILWELSCG